MVYSLRYYETTETALSLCIKDSPLFLRVPVSHYSKPSKLTNRFYSSINGYCQSFCDQTWPFCQH